MARVAFIGLGVMGAPMAGHLARAGHAICVYNRSPEKAQVWQQAHPKGKVALSPREAAHNAEIVLLCVGNDDDLRTVCLGSDGVLAGLGAGCILVDHTTASAEIARELASLTAAKGASFLDAPVSGGQAGAEAGSLSIMVGGDTVTFDNTVPILAPYTKAIRLMGPTGSGQLTKMVNQICAAGVLQGLAEGLNFGQKAGLDMPAVLEVISQGAAGSWQMDNRGTSMIADQFDFGFAVDWMHKDLSICETEADMCGATLPITTQLHQRYRQLQSMGGGRWDTSALIKLL